MNQSNGTSRGAAIVGMIVTFLGGYVLGSMGARGDFEVKDPAHTSRKAVEVGDSPSRGAADALVTIIEFADFQCGYCARSVPVKRRLLEEYGGRVRWVFKHLPLKFHSHARSAALASMAAHAQGRFWDYHIRLFMNQGKLDDAQLLAHAEALGLDMKRFQEDFQQKKHEAAVDADVELAKALRVQGTPNFFINGRHFMGSLSYARMEEAVREEIAYAQKLMHDGVKRADLYRELTQGKPKGDKAAEPKGDKAAEPKADKDGKAPPRPTAGAAPAPRPVAKR